MQPSPALLQALQRRAQEQQQGASQQGQAPQVPQAPSAGVPQPPQNPADQTQGQQNPQDTAGLLQGGQQSQTPQFDDDVRNAAKVLIMKLLKHV